jgi:hypothetical protein
MMALVDGPNDFCDIFIFCANPFKLRMHPKLQVCHDFDVLLLCSHFFEFTKHSFTNGATHQVPKFNYLQESNVMSCDVLNTTDKKF